MMSAFLYVVDEAWILMREAVVVLTPHMGGQQVGERRHRLAPRNLPADFQQFCMLVEHRIDDMDEGLIAREEPVPPCQQVKAAPSLSP